MQKETVELDSMEIERLRLGYTVDVFIMQAVGKGIKITLMKNETENA